MSSLTKPFARVAKKIGVDFKFTQRGLRRTYNDLSRAANVKPEIIRSISGHHTEQMREWYSTYCSRERRAGIAAVIDLVAAHKAARRGARRFGSGRPHFEAGRGGRIGAGAAAC